MILATGAQLAARLETYTCKLHNGQIPRCVGQKISAALDAAEQQLRRKAALEAILDVVDPCGCQSNSYNAKRIEAAIRRLNDASLRRIRSGATATALEVLLVSWLDDCEGQESWRRIYDEIVLALTPD